MDVLVTGGSGYIGSHTVLALLQAGHNVVVLDNFCNSSAESINRIAQICGKPALLVEGDIRDRKFLERLFVEYKVDTVMHFAGLKSVEESATNPLGYYETNVLGSLNLVQAMNKVGTRRIVFSSSATVYGEATKMPIQESVVQYMPTNPYGRSKLLVEQLLQDLVRSDTRWSVASLRYFNPVGAHKSGIIGENPEGLPNNLLPTISRVAAGLSDKLSVFGDDYPTRDGTCVRDYIHVMDLAFGHLSALDFIRSSTGFNVWNLGTGNGYSVLEMVRAFERASGRRVPLEFVDRRAGDIAECYADTTKANNELNWSAEFGIDIMMQDLWRWQSNNPNGYESSE